MLPVGEQGLYEQQPRVCSKGSLGAPLETHGILQELDVGFRTTGDPC